MGAQIQCLRKLGQPKRFCGNVAISTLVQPEMSKDRKCNGFFRVAKKKLDKLELDFSLDNNEASNHKK